MRRKAFTLIELLVVIAIIAILAAILFPVFAQAKLAAKKTAGLAQMKQLATASIMYANDYDDGLFTWQECLADSQWNGNPDPCLVIPFWEPEHFWDSKLLPYVKSGRPELGRHDGIWLSPGHEGYTTLDKDGNRVKARSLGMNQLAFWDINSFFSFGAGVCRVGQSNNRFSGCYFWLKLSEVEEPVDTMLIADSGSAGRYEPMYFLNGYAERFWSGYWCFGCHQWGQPWRYAKEGANYTWMDGHAKYRKGDEIYPNPNHEDTLSWPTPIGISLYCNVRRFQAPTGAMKNDLFNYVTNTLGGTCN
ncbi:MAG: prepilin-type N-terminal cleavage/methylation domain-containing protein [Armatimonadetes bacterium]|nr:prepilin-type N-terminal cleavage/methylation domain-containing protein [Armatimonadota bacterium]